MKIKKLTVSYPWTDPKDAKQTPLYRVERVQDSLDVNPNAMLTKKQLEEFTYASDWRVAVVQRS